MPERLNLTTPLIYMAPSDAMVKVTVAEVQINVLRLDWAHNLVQIETEDERGVVRHVSYKGAAGIDFLATIASGMARLALDRVVADGLIEGGTLREVKAP